MSALALAFKREGSDASVGVNWEVTGSDVGFYPPVSTHLKNAGVDYYAGWHVDKMIANGTPDLVVVGNVASSTNPEWLYVQKNKLNYKSYPEVIAEHFIKPNSIVCAGTYGKSTSTAILTWVLTEAGYDPSFMFGGIAQSGMPSAAMSNSNWSVTEGDEYKASRWDNGPKFAYYSPTHLLLTSVVWDHADVYHTEEDYIAAFQKLIDLVPTTGLRVVSEKALPVLNFSPAIMTSTVTYGRDPSNDYMYGGINQSTKGIQFTITHRITNNQYLISSSCLGEYMADNITGCFALAHKIGIAPEKIIAAIASFPGMKRRLEKRYQNGVVIFDDIAHSPSKARAILQTLREVYARPLHIPFAKPRDPSTVLPLKGEEAIPPLLSRRGREEWSGLPKIYAIFEPNTGNRRPQAASWYDGAFTSADEMIIPRLTKIKIDAKEEAPFEGDHLAKIIGKTQPHTTYIPDDEKLITYIQQKIQPGDVVVFMGSHGFRGMIDRLVAAMSKS